MFYVIQDPEQIEEHVATLRERLGEGASWAGSHWVGFPSGREEFDVFWHEPHHVLAAFQDLDNRSFNGLGLAEPGSRNTLPLVVEINVPWDGLDRRIAGVLLEDPGTGNVLLAHRGGIGGGCKGVGKRAFFDHFRGHVVEVVDGDRLTSVALIATVDSGELLPAVPTFVREVDRIKNLVVHGAPSSTPGFTPEFEGTKKYERAASTVVYEARHGTVVGALATALENAGHRVGNDRERDIFVTGRRAKVEHLFEVKTVVRSTAIYTAVGQLVLNGRARDGRTKLHLVVPLKPTKRFASALAEVGINAVAYDWNEGQPTFTGLPAPT